MDNIYDRVRRVLREVGFSRFPTVAEHTGLSPLTLRKLHYGELANPTLRIVQAVLDFDAARRRGDVKLPPLTEASKRAMRVARSMREQRDAAGEAT